MRLFTYKLTHDTGFAPNPFHGRLTLATCKPGIRRSKSVGDWIAGFTSKALVLNSGGTARAWDGIPRLLYLMKVSERVSIAEYYVDRRFTPKIPQLGSSAQVSAGDNIYRPLLTGAVSPSEFEIVENPSHPAKNDHIETDLSGLYVLVSEQFYYFGREALKIPDEVAVSVPRGPSRYGERVDETSAERFINLVTALYPVGVHGWPHMWDEAETLPNCKPKLIATSESCAR
ncbi:MAG: hypothetical protein ABR578_04110 [Chromatocurvus sp.]